MKTPERFYCVWQVLGDIRGLRLLIFAVEFPAETFWCYCACLKNLTGWRTLKFVMILLSLSPSSSKVKVVNACKHISCFQLLLVLPFFFQFLSLCVGTRDSFYIGWQTNKWPNGKICQYANISIVDTKHAGAWKLAGWVCSQCVWSWQYSFGGCG